ncbi:hypothetical protein BC828DRAFT_412096 [Blastocladiella britannica]|nr:hypothetical protein BC828DRAFT_412096 [Blastocladiella britannica]
MLAPTRHTKPLCTCPPAPLPLQEDHQQHNRPSPSHLASPPPSSRSSQPSPSRPDFSYSASPISRQEAQHAVDAAYAAAAAADQAASAAAALHSSVLELATMLRDSRRDVELANRRAADLEARLHWPRADAAVQTIERPVCTTRLGQSTFHVGVQVDDDCHNHHRRPSTAAVSCGVQTELLAASSSEWSFSSSSWQQADRGRGGRQFSPSPVTGIPGRRDQLPGTRTCTCPCLYHPLDTVPAPEPMSYRTTPLLHTMAQPPPPHWHTHGGEGFSSPQMPRSGYQGGPHAMTAQAVEGAPWPYSPHLHHLHHPSPPPPPPPQSSTLFSEHQQQARGADPGWATRGGRSILVDPVPPALPTLPPLSHVSSLSPPPPPPPPPPPVIQAPPPIVITIHEEPPRMYAAAVHRQRAKAAPPPPDPVMVESIARPPSPTPSVATRVASTASSESRRDASSERAAAESSSRGAALAAVVLLNLFLISKVVLVGSK